MYAKLVFPIGTDYTKICRDIARCIDNSDGAGTFDTDVAFESTLNINLGGLELKYEEGILTDVTAIAANDDQFTISIDTEDCA